LSDNRADRWPDQQNQEKGKNLQAEQRGALTKKMSKKEKRVGNNAIICHQILAGGGYSQVKETWGGRANALGWVGSPTVFVGIKVKYLKRGRTKGKDWKKYNFRETLSRRGDMN